MKRLCFALIASVVACNTPLIPGDAPAMTGAIVARDVAISIGGPPTVHVKETPTSECGVIFLVTPDTRVVARTAGGTSRIADASELTVGRNVRVWANVIMESCPGQSSATVVEIVD